MTLDSTKKKILLAAGPIFAQKGFRGATVREICDSANVNLASINYYFGDKGQLYIDTVIYARQMRAQQVPEPERQPNTTAEEQLRGYVEMLLKRMVALKSAPWQVRLLMREVMQPTDACRKMVREYFWPFLQGLMVLIDEIVGHELGPEQRLRLAFSIVGQCMYYRFAGDVTSLVLTEESFESGFDIEDLVDHVTNFSLGALLSIRAKYENENENGLRLSEASISKPTPAAGKDSCQG